MKCSKWIVAAATALSFQTFAVAESTVGEDVKDAAKAVVHKVKKGTKKAVHAADDATCPLVDGKPKCAVKKGAHKVEDAVE